MTTRRCANYSPSLFDNLSHRYDSSDRHLPMKSIFSLCGLNFQVLFFIVKCFGNAMPPTLYEYLYFHVTFTFHKSGDSLSPPISWQAHSIIPHEHPFEYSFPLVLLRQSSHRHNRSSKGFSTLVLSFEGRAELSLPISFLDTGLGSILYESVVPALSVPRVRNDNDKSYTCVTGIRLAHEGDYKKFYIGKKSYEVAKPVIRWAPENCGQLPDPWRGICAARVNLGENSSIYFSTYTPGKKFERRCNLIIHHISFKESIYRIISSRK